ncbi:formiminotetrahydrofolate cyclodeaminase [Carnobacterium iners]|uniref:Formiminotetrahydrofolate cyclodeaminase n=1 Tax=Carnobacterium iners TaxID=1073423 RepID=A0A1X7MZS7_9LACT|nr:cyclodeaminase/cyclohydrolase family protein [Carnobacterium iners]SEK19467.1 formiminotetrahydrofolate cyclodeaminase [Carnobacterium iners]SMH30021.1 formiminotetrahydrofolate cyclodeaminase [Carnobacterium iners]
MLIIKFIWKLGSNELTPGNGSASALVVGVGAALTRIVAILTIGKPKYAEYNGEMELVFEEMKAVNTNLLECIDRDTEAFNQVSAVFDLPKQKDEDKQKRREAMQAALKYATEIPFETMEFILEAIHLTAKAVGKSNMNAASDLGVAALTMKAGLCSAWLNVCINLSGVKDEAFKNDYTTRGKAILAEGIKIADDIYEEIEKSL